MNVNLSAGQCCWVLGFKLFVCCFSFYHPPPLPSLLIGKMAIFNNLLKDGPRFKMLFNYQYEDEFWGKKQKQKQTFNE